VFVIDTFLDKTGLISWIFWLGYWSLLCRSYWFFLDKANLCWEGMAHLHVLVLADKFGWSEFGLSDLKHGMLRIYSFAFTILANVEIRLN